ncbi:hypothetical protein D3C73_1303940 [compost metagenome]
MFFAEPGSIEQDFGSSHGVPDERRNEQDGSNQLHEHAHTVDHGHELHAERVDERGNADHDGGQDDPIDGEVVGTRSVAHQLEATPDLRQRDLEGQGNGPQGHDGGEQQQPARQPGPRSG